MVKHAPQIFFQVTVFLASFLIFALEPMIGKQLLPLYGGGSSIWTTTMLFFMTALFFGYLYSALIVRLSMKKQTFFHLSLLFVTLFLTLFNFDNQIFVNFKSPIASIIVTLSLSIGFQFLLLSSTSSLLQHWYSFKQKSPYQLYATSNIGALASLLLYPFLIEPNLTLPTQYKVWTILFVVYALLIFIITTYTLRKNPTTPQISASSTWPKISSLTIWTILSMLTNSLLLATTADLTLRISPIPFLWIIPLALYLISFIIPFGVKNWSQDHLPTWFIFIVASGYFFIIFYYPHINFMYKIILELLTLFIFSLVLHSELYFARPKANHLTIYYLMIALGGILGGIFVAILAPTYFLNLWELPLTYLFYILFVTFLLTIRSQTFKDKSLYIIISITSICLLFYAYKDLFLINPNKIVSDRNFYGIVSIIQNNRINQPFTLELYNGFIIHGSQMISNGGENIPTTYYSRSSGVGQAILTHVNYNKPRSMRMGVIGLGAGTIAIYCKPGDYVRFYEINPIVTTYANKYFSYISQCQNTGGDVDIVEGDARIKLSEELKNDQPQHFDILVVDAFSDDAIPPHLITTEAFNLYLSHLSKEGIIAFHISNGYIDLFPLIDAMAAEKNLFVHKSKSDAANWALVTANPANSSLPFFIPIANKNIRPWTDDYTNLFQILNKW